MLDYFEVYRPHVLGDGLIHGLIHLVNWGVSKLPSIAESSMLVFNPLYLHVRVGHGVGLFI